MMKGQMPLIECNNPLQNYNNPEPIANLRLTSYGLDVLNGKIIYFDGIERNW
jgi:hypothetical protein